MKFDIRVYPESGKKSVSGTSLLQCNNTKWRNSRRVLQSFPDLQITFLNISNENDKNWKKVDEQNSLNGHCSTVKQLFFWGF